MIDKNLYITLMTKQVNELISNLGSDDATIKYQSSKALIGLSEEKPARLYPYFDDFVKLFDSHNNILKWTGIIVVGNLAPVDKNNKISLVMPKLFSLLNTGKMITANNTALALGNIAKYKPDLADKITAELLKVESYKYDTDECNRIACGRVIKAFNIYLKKPDKKVLDFLSRQSKSPRHSTATLAQKMLKK